MPCFDDELLRLPIMIDVGFRLPIFESEVILISVVEDVSISVPSFSKESTTACRDL